MTDKRHPPYTMLTIREVIDTMRLLIEKEDCELDTPIVWYHLADGCLTTITHECCHVFHNDEDDDEDFPSWVELTLHDPHRGEEELKQLREEVRKNEYDE